MHFSNDNVTFLYLRTFSIVIKFQLLFVGEHFLVFLASLSFVFGCYIHWIVSLLSLRITGFIFIDTVSVCFAWLILPRFHNMNFGGFRVWACDRRNALTFQVLSKYLSNFPWRERPWIWFRSSSVYLDYDSNLFVPFFGGVTGIINFLFTILFCCVRPATVGVLRHPWRFSGVKIGFLRFLMFPFLNKCWF